MSCNGSPDFAMQHQDFADSRLETFARAEDGAVTVDWVVLTAAIVTLGLGALFYVGSAVPEVAANIKGYMDGVEVGG